MRPSGGASVFVKSSFPQRKIDLQTELQATAVSITLDKEITICSVYIPPAFSLNSQHLDSLLQQLPSPYIILGDFGCLSGPTGFTCWISFAPVFSLIYC